MLVFSNQCCKSSYFLELFVFNACMIWCFCGKASYQCCFACLGFFFLLLFWFLFQLKAVNRLFALFLISWQCKGALLKLKLCIFYTMVQLCPDVQNKPRLTHCDWLCKPVLSLQLRAFRLSWQSARTRKPTQPKSDLIMNHNVKKAISANIDMKSKVVWSFMSL